MQMDNNKPAAIAQAKCFTKSDQEVDIIPPQFTLRILNQETAYPAAVAWNSTTILLANTWETS